MCIQGKDKASLTKHASAQKSTARGGGGGWQGRVWHEENGMVVALGQQGTGMQSEKKDLPAGRREEAAWMGSPRSGDLSAVLVLPVLSGLRVCL